MYITTYRSQKNVPPTAYNKRSLPSFFLLMMCPYYMHMSISRMLWTTQSWNGNKVPQTEWTELLSEGITVQNPVPKNRIKKGMHKKCHGAIP
jgi:hypothetical protein